jgi:phosphatidylinositol-3-phosphatase
MKKLPVLACVVLVAGAFVAAGGQDQPHAPASPRSAVAWSKTFPVYDHIVIVVEENKDYDEIIDDGTMVKSKAPYINGTLRKEGANLIQMFAEEHVSQGNYFWLFSGSNQGVGFRDGIPSWRFEAPNLGTALINRGWSFKGYSEDLPAIGSEAFDDSALYARKHAPWVSFSNVPNGNTVATSSNLRFADFPTGPDFTSLPTIALVVPNLVNDMHNGHPPKSILKGDTWLQDHLDAYYQWAKTHNSLLIVTWDESDNQGGPAKDASVLGLTDPFFKGIDQHAKNMRNRIATIFAGAHIKAGDYSEGKGVTHVNLLRTLEAMYGLPRSGAQQLKAAAGGISDDFITDVFEAAN